MLCQSYREMAHFISSLRCRLILLVLLAVIPAFGVILHSAGSHRDLTAEQAQKNALGAARAIAVEQDRFFENAHQFLITLSRLPQVRDNDRAACRRILAGLLEPLYADLGVADVKGNSLCTALQPGNSMIKLNGRHHSQAVESFGFAAGKLRTESASGKTLVDVAFPVMTSPGILRGVVVAAMDFSWVTRVAVENYLYSGAAFTLVTGDGTVLVRYPQDNDWTGKSIFAKVPSDGLASHGAERSFESLGADGVSRLFAFRQLRNSLGGQAVYAVIDIPTATAFAEAERILIRNLVVLGLLSVLTLAAAWFGADAFVLRRIRDIVAATEKMAAGDLGARSRLPYAKSELGQMARAFDALAEALERREAEALLASRQIEKQRLQQAALYDLNLAVTSTLDVSAVLGTLLERISGLFPFRAVAVSWIEERTGDLGTIIYRNLGNVTEPPRSHGATEEGLPLVVLAQQSPVAVLDARLDPRSSNPVFFRQEGFVSYLGLPLIVKGESLGVLSFYTSEERRFTSEEMEFLNSVVNQAATAIHNSRLYEQTRDQAIELEKSNRIKDEFLGVMSHELRTPLNVIMNYAEALKMGAFGDISGDQEKGTDKIHSQAGHLLTLINGILEITKIESGSVSVQKERFELAEFISETRSDYMMALEKDLNLVWEYPAQLPEIVSDRLKLKQILTNLINNAIKFTDEGSVTVSFQVIDEGRTLELKIIDTGPGIPEDLLPFVFDKFRQIDSTTTRHYSGAGLGLYIVKTFAELLEGSVQAHSKVGEGSVFVVQLATHLGDQVQDSGRHRLGAPVIPWI